MKKILVVDDEFDILTTWRLVLEMEGYEIVTASNGILALDAARAHVPDLIITDWMMPRMDGVALIGALTLDAALSRVPVVLMSAAAKAPRLEHDGVEFHRKPVSIDELLAIVVRLIGAP